MELHQNYQWRRWSLHQATLLKIAEVDENKSHTVVDFVSNVKNISKDQCHKDNYGIINDVLPKDSIIELSFSANPQGKYNESTKGDSPIISEQDIPTLALNILDCIQEGHNIPRVISILSNLSVDILSETILTTWNKLPKDESPEKKRSFFIAMSSTKPSRRALCIDVILPLIKGQETFYANLELLEPVVHWLDIEIADTLILPLLDDENSIFIKDDLAFRHFFSSLSQAQRSHTLSIYLSEHPEGVQKWQFIALSILVESTHMDEKLMSSLVPILDNLLVHHNNDRYIGKIILKLAEELTPKSSKNLVTGLISLCESFKGVLRFRIRNTLNILNQE
ncbi:uncharacterized protein LOC106673012 [Cimex lectularius]|uniref:Uncharacterized protein n=1 Tax=Cimex lectularius TaxID=79782 RepID=A0A8I6SAY6_CIMLE|nr:uncharacterized protein LOC106673012 [Cimex lectularius]